MTALKSRIIYTNNNKLIVGVLSSGYPLTVFLDTAGFDAKLKIIICWSDSCSYLFDPEVPKWFSGLVDALWR